MPVVAMVLGFAPTVAVAMVVVMPFGPIAGRIALRPTRRVGVNRLPLRHAFADARTCGPSGAGTQNGACAASHTLANDGTRGTSNRTPDDGTVAARSVGGYCSTGGASNGAANQSAVAPADGLPKDGACRRTRSAA